ncbi:MAG: hypothetical protein HYX84_08775 [Chloroflexi bacterium]|nr:hypothetical protein [Chloroflexota bacterium]
MEFFTNPWVIGIGSTVIASVIAGLVLYHGFGIGKAKAQKQTSNPQQHTIPISSHPPIEEKIEEKPKNTLLPEEIIGYLDGLPPFQRESAAKNYEGITVSWDVTLFSTSTGLHGETYLNVSSQGKSQPPIICPVQDLARYPEVKVMKKGIPFRVEGQIDHVSNLGVIALHNCQFHF